MILWYKNGDLVWSLDNKIVRGVIEFKFVWLVDWGFYYCVKNNDLGLMYVVDFNVLLRGIIIYIRKCFFVFNW